MIEFINEKMRDLIDDIRGMHGCSLLILLFLILFFAIGAITFIFR